MSTCQATETSQNISPHCVSLHRPHLLPPSYSPAQQIRSFCSQVWEDDHCAKHPFAGFQNNLCLPKWQLALSKQSWLNEQTKVLKNFKIALMANVPGVIKLTPELWWNVEDFVQTWASLQLLIGFLFTLLHLWVVGFQNRVKRTLQNAVISGASFLSN